MNGTVDAQLRELHRVFPGRVAIRKRTSAIGLRWFSLEIVTWGTSPIVWQGDDVPALIAKAHKWMRSAWA